MRTLTLAVLLAFAPPSAAEERPVCKRAERVRAEVIAAHGRRAAGRDICLRRVRARMRWESPGYSSPGWEWATRREQRGYLRALRRLTGAPYSMVKVAVRPRVTRAGVLSPALAPAGTAACIVSRESGGNPGASNGQYAGIAQWSPEAWARHGGYRYASSPYGASYQEQLRVLSRGLRIYGCRDWCPFDGCG